MKRSVKRCLVWFVAAIALCIAGVGVLVWAMEDYGKSIAPPGNEADLETFLAEGPRVFRTEKYLHEGRVFTVVTGKIPDGLSSWIVLPSGPPVYLFDDAGKLSDWVSDSGESPWLEQWLRESRLLADTAP